MQRVSQEVPWLSGIDTHTAGGHTKDVEDELLPGL